jgi:hypothetical protein
MNTLFYNNLKTLLELACAPTRNRTLNLLIKSQLLCQLSYGRGDILLSFTHGITCIGMVRVAGIEPTTNGLKGRCSTS